MVVRLVLLMLVAWCRGTHLFLENPTSTVIHFFSPLKEAIASMLTHRVALFLSSYGASSTKPMTIWSSTPLVQQLKRPKKASREKLSTKKDGTVTGKRSALKASQAYPREFGVAVAKIYRTLQKDASIDDLLEDDCSALLVEALTGVQRRKKQRT